MIHAKLSPSSAHRWLRCPGSVAANEQAQAQPSRYAEEGQDAHHLAEIALYHESNTSFWVDAKIPDSDTVVTQEMAEHVQDYIDYIRAIDADALWVEQTYGLGQWIPDGFGTADAVAVRGSTLYVVDLKYGKGIRVEAERNPQAMLYALGALSELSWLGPFDEVVIVIHQPRLDHVSEWTMKPHELEEWGEWVAERATEALKPGAERVPGEIQCRFCDAKPTCPALKRYADQVVSQDFEDLDGVPKLTDPQLREVLDAAPLIRKWLDAVEQHVSERIAHGDSFPGYKLVEGRSTRKWADEIEAESRLMELLDGKPYQPPKILTPPQAEKALGKKRSAEIAGLIVKPRGRVTLVPESDKRQPIEPGATVDDFSDEG